MIVIDALDKWGGLRHDAPGKKDLQNLLHMLKRWIQVDHLKKLKLVITSWPEHSIAFPDSISIHEAYVAVVTAATLLLELNTQVHD